MSNNKYNKLSPSRSEKWNGRYTYHPTLPSNEIANNFCASTANSIGSLFITSRAYPPTIRLTAFSVSIPRWLQ